MKSDDIRSGVRRLFRLDVHRPDTHDADADQELESLIEEEVAFLVSQGTSREQAREAALARLGARPAEARRRVRTSTTRRARRLLWRDWLDDARADVRVALRSLRKGPAFSAAAILTLALAIGANTSIFSVVNAVLLQPLPVAAPDELVSVWEENPDFGWYQQDAAPANMLDWKEQTAAFADVAGYPSFGSTVTLTGQEEPRLLSAQAVTGNFFGMLGVRAAMGRVFRDEETWRSAGGPVVVLSDRAWRGVFGADRGIVGRTIDLDGTPEEVVGVLPPTFAMPGLDPDLWRPVRWNPESRAAPFFRRAHWARVIARLRPGVSVPEANAELQVVVQRLQQEYPGTNTRMGAGITPLHEFLVGSTRTPLLVMLGAVAVLLLIACANVTNLLLVRAAGRERETALRLALGAGRGRLLRQSLAESGVLALLGGGAGLALGWWGTRALAALQPRGLVPVREVPMNWSVLGYVSLATVLCAAVFGVAPLLWQGRRAPADTLRDDGRSAGGSRQSRRFGEGLLVAQIAMALALTLGAGLLTRSYLLLLRVDPGFDPSNVLAVEVALPGTRYDGPEKVLAFYAALREETAALPGVSAAAVVSRVPLGPASWSSEFAVEGDPSMAPGPQILHRELSGDYLQVLRVPLVGGRMLTDADNRPAAVGSVVVNRAFVRAYFPNRDPIGRRITFNRVPDSTAYWRTIVGVVGDERQQALSGLAKPEVIAPLAQELRRDMTLVLRTGGDPAALGPAVRGIIARLDPALAITSIRTMDGIRQASLRRERFLTILMGIFAIVGLVLGLVGNYGVVAQIARRRTREMGIRIALGARTRQVQWLVVRRGVVLAAIGIGAGTAAALAVAGVIRSLLYEVAPADPLTFVLVPALVLATTTAAAWLPAVRAGRADPTEVLRSD